VGFGSWIVGGVFRYVLRVDTVHALVLFAGVCDKDVIVPQPTIAHVHRFSAVLFFTHQTAPDRMSEGWASKVSHTAV
jgi:hypothetical protein